MQGSFIQPQTEPQQDESEAAPQLEAPININWDDTLHPGMDEETRAIYRQRRARDQYERAQYRQRTGRDPPPHWYRTERPIAPIASFRCKGRRVFMLSHPARGVDTRPALAGHYTSPYIRDPGTNLAIPVPQPDPIPPPRPLMPGDPVHPAPDLRYCVEDVHFVRARRWPSPDQAGFYEISEDVLRQSLEDAEARDFTFAKTMQGFGNVAMSAVWDCLDPDFNPVDREAVSHQFMTKFLDRFYSSLDPLDEDPGVRAVAAEGLEKHKVLCQEWVRKHYKNLTPSITSPAEALAGEFYPHIEPVFHPDFKPTRMELARMFMRDPDMAPVFAQSLYYFMTNIEHTRGGRNASYKQMSMVSTARVESYNRLGNWIGQHFNLIRARLAELASLHSFMFHPLIVDWYSIAGQMPDVHKEFNYSADLARVMHRARPGQAPPWAFGRH